MINTDLKREGMGLQLFTVCILNLILPSILSCEYHGLKVTRMDTVCLNDIKINKKILNMELVACRYVLF